MDRGTTPDRRSMKTPDRRPPLLTSTPNVNDTSASSQKTISVFDSEHVDYHVELQEPVTSGPHPTPKPPIRADSIVNNPSNSLHPHVKPSGIQGVIEVTTISNQKNVVVKSKAFVSNRLHTHKPLVEGHGKDTSLCSPLNESEPLANSSPKLSSESAVATKLDLVDAALTTCGAKLKPVSSKSTLLTSKSTLPVSGTGKSTLPVSGTGKSTLPVSCTGKSTLPVSCTGKSTLPVSCTGKSTLSVSSTNTKPLLDKGDCGVSLTSGKTTADIDDRVKSDSPGFEIIDATTDMLNLNKNQDFKEMLHAGKQVFHILAKLPYGDPLQRVVIVKSGQDAETALSKAVNDVTQILNKRAAQKIAQGYKIDKETVIEITRIADTGDGQKRTSAVKCEDEAVDGSTTTPSIPNNNRAPSPVSDSLPDSQSSSQVGSARSDYNTFSQLLTDHEVQSSTQSSTQSSYDDFSFDEDSQQDSQNDSHDSCSMNDSLTNIQWLGNMKGDNLQVVNHKDMRLIASEKQIEKVNLECGKHKRPPYSYMHLIQMAICSKPSKKMSLKDIYNWIEAKFPYYKSNPNKGWRNSIRHNLSLYDIFVRERVDLPGKTSVSYWTLRSDMQARIPGVHLNDSLSVKGEMELPAPMYYVPHTQAKRKPVPLLPKPSPADPEGAYAVIPIQGGVPVVPSQPILLPANWTSQHYSIADVLDNSLHKKRSASPVLGAPHKKHVRIAPKVDPSNSISAAQFVINKRFGRQEESMVAKPSPVYALNSSMAVCRSLSQSDVMKWSPLVSTTIVKNESPSVQHNYAAVAPSLVSSIASTVRPSPISSISEGIFSGVGLSAMGKKNMTSDITSSKMASVNNESVKMTSFSDSLTSVECTSMLSSDLTNQTRSSQQDSGIASSFSECSSDMSNNSWLNNRSGLPKPQFHNTHSGQLVTRSKRKRKSPHNSIIQSSPNGEGHLVVRSSMSKQDGGIGDILASIEKKFTTSSSEMVTTPTKEEGSLFTSTPFKQVLDSPVWISPIKGLLMIDGETSSLFTPPSYNKSTSSPRRSADRNNGKGSKDLASLCFKGDSSPELGSLRSLGLAGFTPLKPLRGKENASPGGHSSPGKDFLENSTFGKLLGDMHLDSIIDEGITDMENISFTQLGV